MYCSKCGKEIKETAKFCNYCGNPTKNNIKNKNSEADEKANKLCTISLALICFTIVFWFFGVEIDYYFPAIANIIKYFIGIMPLTALVLIIIARIKYPKNLFAKVLTIVYIVTTITTLISLFLLLLLVRYTCEKIDENCGEEIRACGSMGQIVSKKIGE